MAKQIVRVVTRGSDGEIRVRDYDSFERLDQSHEQIGVDDCSTDLTLRGLPVYRGLVGPMADGNSTVRYESPEIFEVLTKEWSAAHIKRRRRRKMAEVAEVPL
jgi:hypothetical protein